MWQASIRRAMAVGLTVLITSFSAVASAGGKAGYQVSDVPHPELTTDQRGQLVRHDELRGRVVLISFWATWCQPCLKELPVLETFQRAVPDTELKVIAISIDRSRRQFSQMMANAAELQMAVLHDRRGRLAKAFGVKAVPHLFLIDHQGNIAEMHRGYTEDKLDQYIDEVNALLKAGAEALSGSPADA